MASLYYNKVATKAMLAEIGFGKRHIDGLERVKETKADAPEWHAAQTKALAIVDAGGMVALLGPRGPGKTQLACCVCHRLISRHFLCDEFGARINSDAQRPPASEYVYSRAMDFFLSIRATFGGKSSLTEFDVTRQYADARLLVLDELQERGETPFEDRLLANVIDKRYAASLPTILIANIEANEFPAYVGASISDRLNETGGLIECGWGSFRG